jgi:hypothetical protein
MIETAAAVERIGAGILRHQARVEFPLKMALAMRLLHVLPESLRIRAVHRFL